MNHGNNKTVNYCEIIDQAVKRISTKKNEQKFVYLSTIILHFLVHYSCKLKKCI